MDDLAQDLRYALRTLAKNPMFTLIVVSTLALGIGANTAIFGLMDQMLLRLLPVKAPERLVVLDMPGSWSGSSHQVSSLEPMSEPMFAGLRDRNEVFSGILAHYPASLHLTVGDRTEQVDGDLVSGTYFQVLGLESAQGRLFGPDDDRTPGAHPVVVLSHGFWTRRFAADPKIVGQAVRINDTPMTIVGVAPRGFHGVEVGESIDVFVPIMMQRQMIPTWQRGLGDWRTRWLIGMARLKDGVTLEQAKAGVNVLYAQLTQEDLAHVETPSARTKAAFEKRRLELLPGGRGTSELRETSGKPLGVLMGMVGLVLLIACANVANLLLTRASSRQKEIAVRLALGASRLRLVRQLLVESIVLSLAGGALGLLVAVWAGDALVHALPSSRATEVMTAAPNLRVGLFTLVLSLATGVLFGLAPALQSTRAGVATTLKSEAGAVVGGGTFRLRKGLVVAQVALSLLLLIGSGLFTRSLLNLRALDPGFESDRLLAFDVDPSLNGYSRERRVQVIRAIQEQIGAEPGVRDVSMARIALMTDSDSSSTVGVVGYTPKEDENMNPNFNEVGPGFFETLGIPIVDGRDFGDADGAETPKVAIVNETFAKYFFGAESPLGHHVTMGGSRGFPKLDMEIVGMVRDGKAASLREKPKRFIYRPYTQEPNIDSVTFYVRSAIDTATLAPRLRAVVQRVDATLPVTSLKTMRAQIDQSLFVDRAVAALSAAFGALATLLAAIGLYGVMSYAVAARTREIGIRMALGAARGTVLSMVLQEVALLAAIGIAVGLPSGYGLGRVVESRLFGLTARDPLTYVVATLTLLAAALLAGWVPARRATRVDPMVALRCD